VLGEWVEGGGAPVLRAGKRSFPARRTGDGKQTGLRWRESRGNVPDRRDQWLRFAIRAANAGLFRGSENHAGAREGFGTRDVFEGVR